MESTAMIRRVERLESLVQRALGGGGDIALAFASTVVWRPGGVTAGNVYATWAEVVAAVARINGEVTVGVDVDLAAATIPVGAWDLRPAGVSGPVYLTNASKTTVAPFVTTAAGAVTIHGLNGLTDVQFNNLSTVTLMTATNVDRFDFYLRGFGSIFHDVVGPAFIAATGGSGSFLDPTVNFYMKDFAFLSTLGGGVNALQATLATGAAIDVFINDTAAIDVNQISGTGFQVLVSANPPGSVPSYATQAAAATIAPLGLLARGAAAIVALTGKTAAIAAFVTATTRIFCNQRVAANDGGATPTVRYEALAADRVIGNPGTFQISALTNAGAGATNPADTSTVEFEVYT